MENILYYGDNLDILREHVANESIDLIYLDPPFNSQATYNVLFSAPGGKQSQAQVEAFEDTWHWSEEAEKAYSEIMKSGNTDASEMLQAIRSFLGENDLMAYLTMMAIRLLELYRALKVTGSIYLHCDPVASHYLKILMDSVFGPKNFRNEIIWRRTGSNSAAKRFGPIHQTIFYYVKSDKAPYYPVAAPYTKAYVEDFFTDQDERGKYQSVALTGPGIRTGDSGLPWRHYDPAKVGRHWQPASYLYAKYKKLAEDDLAKYPLLTRLDKLDKIGLIHWGKSETVPRYKFYLADAPGVFLQDIWAYQPGTEGCVYKNPDAGIDQAVKWLSTKDKERLGYQTQKPLGLLERIIKSSAPDDGLVLDPFCGCGTTVHAAEKLGRKWIGIDITHLAISLIERRLKEAFPHIKYQVHGTPKDLDGARDLAKRDKYEFQWWVLPKIDALPYGGKKKGADSGIDGLLYFQIEKSKMEKAIVSVKGGEHIDVKMIRELAHVVKIEKAKIGIFVTLFSPTKPMQKEAVKEGYLETKFGKYRRLQILTIEDIFAGKKPHIPFLGAPGFKRTITETSEEEIDLPLD